MIEGKPRLRAKRQAASVNENIGGGFPPDGDIATSQHFTVQMNNFVLTMYNLDTGIGAQAGTSSFLEMAVSKTGDPTGQWFVYTILVNLGPGDFADFPQMGMDVNSIIITFNDFPAAGGFDARTFANPKAYFYNGLFQGVPIFGGSGCTVAPPYVLDNGGPLRSGL